MGVRAAARSLRFHERDPPATRVAGLPIGVGTTGPGHGRVGPTTGGRTAEPTAGYPGPGLAAGAVEAACHDPASGRGRAVAEGGTGRRAWGCPDRVTESAAIPPVD